MSRLFYRPILSSVSRASSSLAAVTPSTPSHHSVITSRGVLSPSFSSSSSLFQRPAWTPHSFVLFSVYLLTLQVAMSSLSTPSTATAATASSSSSTTHLESNTVNASTSSTSSPAANVHTQSSKVAATDKKKPSLLSRSHVIESNGLHKATIIWMHGLGDSSEGFRGLFESIKPLNTRVILPNAPVQAVTINGGMKMQSWYDIYSLDRHSVMEVDKEFTGKHSKEDDHGIEKSYKEVLELVLSEIEVVGAENVLVGGFSQGSSLALYLGLRIPHTLAGIVCCSGYTLRMKTYPAELHEKAKTQNILVYHGEDDEVVPMNWSFGYYKKLKEMGINLDIHSEPDLGHSLSDPEIFTLLRFFKKALKQPFPAHIAARM